MSNIIGPPSPASSGPPRFPRTLHWAYRLWGVDLRFGAALSTLIPEHAKANPSPHPRALGSGDETRPRDRVEAGALGAWEWEGGRTVPMEVPR
jgi:hypothetical protein